MPLRCIMGEIKSLKTKIPDAGEGLLTGYLPRLPGLSKIKNLRVPLLNVVWKVIGPGPVWTLMNHLAMSKVPSRRALGCWLPPCPRRHEDIKPRSPFSWLGHGLLMGPVLFDLITALWPGASGWHHSIRAVPPSPSGHWGLLLISLLSG